LQIIIKKLPSKKAILYIANPCSENWEKMSDVACGKFCGACQKHVIDFTAMSDTELGRIINTTKGEICGRMTPAQMNRPIVLETYPSQCYTRWLMTLTALASFSGNLLAKPFHILPDVKIFQLHVNNKIDKSDSLRKFKFYVVDSLLKEPIAFALVNIKELGIVEQTGLDGVFEFKIPNSISKFTIEVIQIGYQSKFITINMDELTAEQNGLFKLTSVFDLPNKPIELFDPPSGLVCVEISKKPTFWQKLKNKFRIKEH
jgi:hypothetical protein